PFGAAPQSPVQGFGPGAVAPTPVGAPAPSPVASPAARVEAVLGGPICGRCRGVGDPGSVVCKFCGARYADAPPVESLSTTAHGPHQAEGPLGVESTLAPDVRLVAILKDGSDGAVHPLHVPATDL